MTLKKVDDDDRIGCAIVAAIVLGLVAMIFVASSNTLGKYFESERSLKVSFAAVVGIAVVAVRGYWQWRRRTIREPEAPPGDPSVAAPAAPARSKVIGGVLVAIGIAATIVLARTNATAAFGAGFVLQWAGLWIVLRGQTVFVRFGGSFFVAIFITVQLLARIGAWR